MMRFAAGILVLVCAFGLGVAPVVHAVPMVFEESFLGSADDGLFFSMAESADAGFGEGDRARFNFDLTAPGGDALLINSNYTGADRIMDRQADPDPDAFGYVPGDYGGFESATLQFFVSDTDGGALNRESLRVSLLLDEGGRQIIYTESFQVDSIDSFDLISVDLGLLGWLDQLNDGILTSFAIAPAFGDVSNDFILDRVTLTATASPAPVPEPGTMVLLGIGIIGVACSRKKFRKK